MRTAPVAPFSAFTKPLAPRGAAAFKAPAIAPPTKAASSGLTRNTFTADNKELPDLDLGRLVRKEGQAPIGDKAIDDAHDNAGIVHDFFKTVLGRDSVDGKGMPLNSTAHYDKNFNNAYWNGQSMTYGDGDGKAFSPLSGSLDVVAHEISHGVTERTGGLNYEFQSGALNESFSDVFGELAEQWKRDPKTFATPAGAATADWMIGEDIFTPGTPGDALRSLKTPGSAYPGDPQPAHMKNYKDMPFDEDNGGVHINSGIPNKAAYEAALKLGGEKTAKVWYKAMTDYMRPNSQFKDAANYTVSAARDLFGREAPEVQAVRDAWKGVGLVPRAVPVRDGSEPRPATVTSTPNPGTVPAWLNGGLAPKR